MQHTNIKYTSLFVTLLVLTMFMSGCNKVYYSTMEKFGKEKRHILVNNVEDVKDSQTKAQEEFTDALTRIKELYAFEGGELEKFYKRFKSSYEDCDDRARQIEKRINSVKQVAEDLFKEWKEETAQINDAKLKKSSRESFLDAKAKYSKLETVMTGSTQSMYPVLAKLKDYVLYLKHNLNAQAVGSLSGEVISIEKDVAGLIKEMTASIKEAQNFINNFQ
jgi:F0F1-type ATP synthase membrane subunit b/b'